MQGSIAGALLAAVAFSPMSAVAMDLQDLAGKSIQSRLTQRIDTPRGELTITYNDRVYISTQGRIFHKVSIQSSNPMSGGNKDLVSGENPGSFQLQGNTLVRSWTNRNTGTRLTQAITLSGSTPGSGCTVSVQRDRNVPVQDVSQSCQVVSGNIVSR